MDASLVLTVTNLTYRGKVQIEVDIGFTCGTF